MKPQLAGSGRIPPSDSMFQAGDISAERGHVDGLAAPFFHHQIGVGPGGHRIPRRIILRRGHAIADFRGKVLEDLQQIGRGDEARGNVALVGGDLFAAGACFALLRTSSGVMPRANRQSLRGLCAAS